MEYNKREPIYQQIAREIKVEILQGKLEPGDRLPSRREYARTHKVNPNTVQRAYQLLEEADIIVTEPNVPSRVTEEVGVLEALKAERIHKLIREFYEATQAIGLSLEQVVEELERLEDESC